MPCVKYETVTVEFLVVSSNIRHGLTWSKSSMLNLKKFLRHVTIFGRPEIQVLLLHLGKVFVTIKECI